MKPNHETIYLVPTDYDGGQLTYSWCDCPAPGEGMDPADAIKYVRADLVPASNEMLARRIVELTNERDAIKAQVEQLREFALNVNRKCADYIMDGKRIDFEALGVSAFDAYRATPAQCLAARDAEIKAQVVENLEEPLFASGKADADIGEWLKEQAKLIRQQVKGGE